MKAKWFTAYLLFLLCLLLLSGCVRSEVSESTPSYAELLAAVRQENTDAEVYTVLNHVPIDNWCVVGDRIHAFGGWYAKTDEERSTEKNLYVTCSYDGNDVTKLPLLGAEPVAHSLTQQQEGQELRTVLRKVITGPSDALYVIQEDLLEQEIQFEENGQLWVQYELEAQFCYLRTVTDGGALSEPLLLQFPEKYTDVAQVFFDEKGYLWMAVNSDVLQAPIQSALLCFSSETGSLLKSVSLPDNAVVDNSGKCIFLPDGQLVVHARNLDIADAGRTEAYGKALFFSVRDLATDSPTLSPLYAPKSLYTDDSTWILPSAADPSSGDIFVVGGGMGISRWNIDSGEVERVLKWEDYQINFRNVAAVLNLSAEEWLIVLQEESYGDFSFVRITTQDASFFEGRGIITVAVPGQYAETVQQAANTYNFNSPEKLIRVLDYSDAAAAGKGFTNGSEMLNDDIISGNVPDIVLTSAENITAHIRKGLFTDLYPFIDADAQLSRTDFVAGALAATEQDGTLPIVLLSYNLLTAVGDPDVVGSAPGWTWEEFYSVLAANPQAKTPYYLYDRYYVLLYQLMLGGSDYLDYSTGTAHLDSPEFIRVLESSAAYPAENGDYTADPKPVFAARQSLLNIQFIGDFRSVIAQNYAFDGPVVYKGFPSDNGGGSAFTSVLRGGITSYCTDPDAAWQFLRTLLLPEFQDNIQHSLPVRRDSLQKLAQAAAEPGQMAGLPPYLAGVTLTESQQEYWKRGITEEESTALLELIESTDVLYQYDSTIASILWEEADYFYNGVRTAEEAAALIQSRVQTYLAEQG